jgi:hypothetical protein
MVMTDLVPPALEDPDPPPTSPPPAATGLTEAWARLLAANTRYSEAVAPLRGQVPPGEMRGAVPHDVYKERNAARSAVFATLEVLSDYFRAEDRHAHEHTDETAAALALAAKSLEEATGLKTESA